MDDEVEADYQHIRRQLMQFLDSTAPLVEAESILSQNVYAYIFTCFRIDPLANQNGPGRVTADARHAVQLQVIREALKDMVVVPSGILRVHVRNQWHGPVVETPIKQGNLLWYRVDHNSQYDFKIINMLLDATVGLGLTQQTGHKTDTRVGNLLTEMQISDDDAQQVAVVRLDPANLRLFTFAKDGHTVLRVLFTTPGVDFPFPSWCDIPQRPGEVAVSSVSADDQSDGTHTLAPPSKGTAKSRILQLLKDLENLIRSDIPDGENV
jgi:hypothetical protein